jgi:hypothetical protein
MAPGAEPPSQEGGGEGQASRTYGGKTSPYWNTYRVGPNQFSFERDGGPPGVEKTRRFTDYDDYYPVERDYGGCGGGGYSRSPPGWQRALQDTNLAAIVLVAGAAATYLLYTSIPTAFRRKRRAAGGPEEELGEAVWSGKMRPCGPVR